MRALLAERLQGRPTRANFRTGHLTICTLVPMRSVPHRVVCLLGLDDGVFPRKAPRDGDDLMLDDPHVGDRDPRTEDRQLLLDALLAATRPADRHLHRQRRAHERAAPAGGARRRAARRRRRARSAPTTAPARERVVVRHPLQPFDPRNFTPGGARARRRLELRPRHARRARARSTGPRAGAGAVPRRPAARRATPRRRARRPRALRRSTRCARSCASGSGSASATSPTRSRTTCRSSSTASSSGASASGCSTRGSPARTGATAVLAEIARGTLPPGLLGRAGHRATCARSSRRSSPRPRALVGRRRAGRSVDVRVALARRALARAARSPGVSGDVLRAVTYSRVERRATASPRGCACSR